VRERKPEKVKLPRIIFINRFFSPDISATSQILSDLAFHLASRGHKVVVVTSRQRYDDPGARLRPREVVNGVDVLRVATTRFGRGNLIGRFLDYFTFYVSTLCRLLILARQGDTLVAKTDPPLISVVVATVALLRRARLANWLQDVFPEIAITLGMRALQGHAGRVCRRFRDFSTRHATVNVAICQSMRNVLGKIGVPPSSLRVVPNWCDDREVMPIPREGNALRAEWGLGNRFVVGYSGNLGRVHEFDTILQAAKSIATRRDIAFLVVGGGAQLEYLRRYVDLHALENVIFKPYQPAGLLAKSLSVPDLHLVSLKAGLEGLVFPSKFYGIAAAGRPTAFIGDPVGELGTMLNQHKCGRAFQIGDYKGLAEFISTLASDPGKVQAMGRNARDLISRECSRARRLNQWEELLTSPGLAPD
jgi:glycosyltransferase involved in cell wall biosynthesis